MNDYLTQEIWKMRKRTKTDPDTPVVSLVKVEGKTYQLLFLTCGCDRACSFCNYGFDYDLTFGSFLSEREIPYDLFLAILKFVAHKNIPIITMETHYKTITEKRLQDIRRILGNEQTVNFELGFESVNDDVRDIYNKDINLEEYLEVARLCEKYDIGLEINVLLGAPFLSRKEQIQDCLDSLEFIFSKMPEGTIAVLFPINIKNDTMLKHWQDIGVYDQISSWEFVELIHKIPEKYLDRYTIAWWGSRENAFTTDAIQHPKTCDKCRDRLMDFYTNFYCNWDINYRKKIIEEIWNSRCECDSDK